MAWMFGPVNDYRRTGVYPLSVEDPQILETGTRMTNGEVSGTIVTIDYNTNEVGIKLDLPLAVVDTARGWRKEQS